MFQIAGVHGSRGKKSDDFIFFFWQNFFLCEAYSVISEIITALPNEGLCFKEVSRFICYFKCSNKKKKTVTEKREGSERGPDFVCKCASVCVYMHCQEFILTS